MERVRGMCSGGEAMNVLSNLSWSFPTHRPQVMMTREFEWPLKKIRSTLLSKLSLEKWRKVCFYFKLLSSIPQERRLLTLIPRGSSFSFLLNLGWSLDWLILAFWSPKTVGILFLCYLSQFMFYVFYFIGLSSMVLPSLLRFKFPHICPYFGDK